MTGHTLSVGLRSGDLGEWHQRDVTVFTKPIPGNTAGVEGAVILNKKEGLGFKKLHSPNCWEEISLTISAYLLPENRKSRHSTSPASYTTYMQPPNQPYGVSATPARDHIL